MELTRRAFNFILSCILMGWKKPAQDKRCVTLEDKDIKVSIEPEFEILSYHKPDREIVYNILKSGTQTRQQIKERILSRARVVYRR